jgi:hypothetical protein
MSGRPEPRGVGSAAGRVTAGRPLGEGSCCLGVVRTWIGFRSLRDRLAEGVVPDADGTTDVDDMADGAVTVASSLRPPS